MRFKEEKIKLYLIMLLPITILFNYIASKNPLLVHEIYSTSIYRGIGMGLSNITGVLPFSLGEFIAVGSYFLVIFYFIYIVVKIIKTREGRAKLLRKYILNILLVISLVYSTFIMIWGLNYNRLSFDKIINLDIKPASVGKLKDLNTRLAEKANVLRESVVENGQGVMKVPEGFNGVRDRAYIGYENLSLNYPFFSGTYGKPKGIFLSEIMCYTGISGVYFPFTAEANINIAIPDFMLPATTCHEMAHQRGFAKEEEANYIAYLACLANPNEEFQYSGVMLALIHSMNALYSEDKELYYQVRDTLSEGVIRDLEYNNKFWNRYEGKIENVTDKINDTYLKANNQKAGTKSYGMMVDLLLAENFHEQN